MLAAKHNEPFEPMEAKTKATNEQLDEVTTTSGKKSPVQKKLFTRLHFELRYPLNDKQAKKIKVTPHAEEGVPKKP